MGSFNFQTTPPSLLSGAAPKQGRPYDMPIGPTAPMGPAPTPSPGGGVDTNAMMKMFMDLAKQQLQNQQQSGQAGIGFLQDAKFGHHLGTGAGDADPWSAGGLFHGGFGSQMSPEALAAGRGSTAVNQWNNPQMFHSNAWRGPTTNEAQGRVVSPGVGPFNTSGERQFDDAAGRSTEYDPRQDQMNGPAAIRKMYDPAYRGDPQFRGGGAKPQPRGIPRMF